MGKSKCLLIAKIMIEQQSSLIHSTRCYLTIVEENTHTHTE